jgi:dienelactone hydrolase
MSPPIRFLHAAGIAAASGFILLGQSVIQLSTTSISAIEGADQVLVSVQRTNNLDTVVSVDYATTNLTATAGADYLDVAGTLSFAVGETTLAIAIPILNDGEIESGEGFQIDLSNPSAGAILGVRTSAGIRITDNDVGLQVEYGSYRVAEDGGTATIVVVRGDDANFPVSVDFATVDGAAQAGADYVATGGTLTFAPGERLREVRVTILNDGLQEGLETFRIKLANPSTGGALGNRKLATVSIIDNDPGVGFDRDVYALGENEPALRVRLLRGNDMQLGPFTVDLFTTDKNAIGGLDYVKLSTALAFAEGEMEKVVEVQSIPDETVEVEKQFSLNLQQVAGDGVIGLGKATVTVFDGTGFVPARFEAVTALPDGGLRLTTVGRVPSLFAKYHDLYRAETSVDLAHWSPWLTLLATNNATSAPSFVDAHMASQPMRYYRLSSQHGLTPYGRPPGPFPVGVVSRMVHDPSQRDRYARLPGEAAFMISVWYPAVAEAGIPLAPLEDQMVVLKVNWGGKRLRHFFRSSAQAGVACAEAGAPYPVLAYSPGGWGLRTEVAERGPFLASHGFVVVAADPIDAPGTTFPDGTHLAGRSEVVGVESGFQSRVRDIQAVLEELTRWNQEDPLFKGRLDVTNVAVAGWSWGAGAAAEVCRVDARCRAALSFEGYYQNAATVLISGLAKPLLGLYAATLHDAGSAMTLHNKASRDSVWFQVKNTDHTSFSDYYWSDSPTAGGEAAAILNTYSLWFLNRHLKGRNEEIPNPQAYPRIFNFRQK